MTAADRTPARPDVIRSLVESLAEQAQSTGSLTSAHVARILGDAGVSTAQGKKILQGLSATGVTVIVDGSADTRPPRRAKVAAARSATTPASKAATAKAPGEPAEPAKKAPARKAADAAGKPAAKTAAKKAPAKKAGAKGEAAPAAAGEPGKEGLAVDEPIVITEAEEEEDFSWDDEDEESEALKQARRDAELTASADSVRAYLKQIGKVPLLNAEQEVELAKRIEAGLYAAERLPPPRRAGRSSRRRCGATCAGSPGTASGPRTTCSRRTCAWWCRWPSATPVAAWRSWT